jgi:hypothetical protein
MLAQKIALETSEVRALSVANNFVPNDWAGIIPRCGSHGPRGFDQQASRRPDRITAVDQSTGSKVKNRTHPAMVPVMEGFAWHARFHSLL